MPASAGNLFPATVMVSVKCVGYLVMTVDPVAGLEQS